MTRNDIIKAQADLNRVRKELDDKEFKEKTLPTLLGLVDKCFVFRRNSYSCPEKESDYWDLFRRVLAVVPQDGYADVVYREVQIDKYGHATIRTASEPSALVATFHGRWETCKRSEYDAMHRRTAAAVVNGRTVLIRLRAERKKKQ